MNNRIVKFRVYKDDKLQYPVRPGDSKEGDLREIFFDSDKWVEERHGILMQFTGLLDKNRKEIYEGDILKLEYTSSHDLFDEKGKFIGWAQNLSQFELLYEVLWYSGEYYINCNDYTIALNGWAAKVIKDNRKSTHDNIGEIFSLGGGDPRESNYGYYGLDTSRLEIVGNIFENPEIL